MINILDEDTERLTRAMRGQQSTLTSYEIDRALDNRQLWVRLGSKYFLARRNGMTKRWKRDPLRFRIPFKYRFNDCHWIDETTLILFEANRYERIPMDPFKMDNRAVYVISAQDPN